MKRLMGFIGAIITGMTLIIAEIFGATYLNIRLSEGYDFAIYASGFIVVIGTLILTGLTVSYIDYHIE